MGGGGSKAEPKEEIIIQQQQQQQQQIPSTVAISNGIGPAHVIAVCAVLLLVGLLGRFVWRLVTREIDIRTMTKRSESVATIV